MNNNGFYEDKDDLGNKKHYVYFILCLDPLFKNLPKVELYIGSTGEIELRKKTQIEGDQVVNGHVYHQSERLKQYKTKIWLKAICSKGSGSNFSYAAGQESAWFYMLKHILPIIGIEVYSK